MDSGNRTAALITTQRWLAHDPLHEAVYCRLMQLHSPKNWKLKQDPFLLEISVPGIFAADDVRHGPVRPGASAIGQGAIAISLIHQ